MSRGIEPFEFTIEFMGVFNIYCNATFVGGQLMAVTATDEQGRAVNPDGVILDWPPAGEFIPFAECLRWHAQSLYAEHKAGGN